jgi:hypothetical protein
MKTYGGMDVYSNSFLILALVVGVWLASCQSQFTPQYSLDRRMGGPQSESGHSGKEKFLALLGLQF